MVLSKAVVIINDSVVGQYSKMVTHKVLLLLCVGCGELSLSVPWVCAVFILFNQCHFSLSLVFGHENTDTTVHTICILHA